MVAPAEEKVRRAESQSVVTEAVAGLAGAGIHFHTHTACQMARHTILRLEDAGTLRAKDVGRAGLAVETDCVIQLEQDRQ